MYVLFIKHFTHLREKLGGWQQLGYQDLQLCFAAGVESLHVHNDIYGLI